MCDKVVYILAIESSCDDTSVAVLKNDKVLSNIVCSQAIHTAYGGVVPEMASRSHQKNILPTLVAALERAKVSLVSMAAICYTNGPGLLGSLLVGSAFAKSLALALEKPLIAVDHLQGHVLCHFIDEKGSFPKFPFLALTISGGHTQLVRQAGFFDYKTLGTTRDDAVGEAFDKCAKLLGLSYPGGVLIDKLAAEGDREKFKFVVPKLTGLDFSFSGLKTAFKYFLEKNLLLNSNFITENLNDLCASLQYTITQLLVKKVSMAMAAYGLNRLVIGGGVSANSEIRKTLDELAKRHAWELFLPRLEYTTDNAAMIGIVGYYKFKNKHFDSLKTVPFVR